MNEGGDGEKEEIVEEEVEEEQWEKKKGEEDHCEGERVRVE
jgi:hypothetical protein